MARDSSAHLVALGREGRLLADAARGALDRPVPACPGWTVASVLGHLGRVYRSVTAHVATRAEAPVPAEAIPRPPEGAHVLAWFVQAHTAAVEALSGIAADEAVWTWSDDKTGGFYHRRMANETLIHRIDVEQAVGSLSPVDLDHACDAIPELYEVLLPFALTRRAQPLPGGSLHLRCTDGPRSFTVGATDGRIVLVEGLERADAPVLDAPVLDAHVLDAHVAGPAGDLVRYVWNRGRSDAVVIDGDEAVASAWVALAP
jgi:uncharacterized protein (TIGR03083 family)